MPVNVMAGCSASGTAPAARTGCRIPTPKRPEVCATSWPGCQAPSLASPSTSGPRASSGTASRTSSARSTMSCTSSIGTPGRSVSARSRLASETADDPDDGVLGAAQRRPQDGADLPGADDSDAEASWFSHDAGLPGVSSCGWCAAGSGRRVQPVLALLALARGAGTGRLGIEQGPGLVEAGLDEPRGHRTGRGVQDQVRHPEPPGERALLERHGLGALVRHHHEVPPPAARPQEQGGLRCREAVAPPAQRRQEPGPARAGDEAAVASAAFPAALPGIPAGSARPVIPAVNSPTGSGVPGSGSTRERISMTSREVSHRKQRGPGRSFAGAAGQAVAGHVDLDPVPAEHPPQRRLADLQRLDPARRNGLRLRVQQAVAQPDAVRGNGGGEVVALVERGPVGGDESDRGRDQEDREVPVLRDGGEHHRGNAASQDHDTLFAQEQRAHQARRRHGEHGLFRGLHGGGLQLSGLRVSGSRTGVRARGTGGAGQDCRAELPGLVRAQVRQAHRGFAGVGDFEPQFSQPEDPCQQGLHDVDRLHPVQPGLPLLLEQETGVDAARSRRPPGSG